jgi:DNA-binding transcriptional MerR regulator
VTWTLEELADRAAQALADADVRVANGRVTGVPDGRLIRWYATIGLVDRPTLGAGRVARYGHRHLLQLVAVKRLQAQGLPLTEVQRRLAGATDTTLRAIAALPPAVDRPTEDRTVPTYHALVLPVPSEDGDQARGAEATERPRRPTRRRATRRDAGSTGEPAASAPAAPAPATPTEGVSARDAPLAGPRFWTARPTAAPTSIAGDPGLDTGGDTVTRVYGVRIRDLTLLLPAPPADDDLDAIAAAARPLLDLLAERGLLHRTADETPRRGAPE